MITRLLRCTALALALCASAAAAPAESQAPVAGQREILPAGVRPLRTAVTVTPDLGALTFTGEARIEVEVLRATDRVVMNAARLSFDRVSLAGRPAPRVELDETLERVTLVFDRPLPAGRHTLEIAYKGKINENATGLFITSAGGGGKPVLMSQFQPGYGRAIAPMWDEPAVKSVFELALVVPEAHLAVSNMPATASTPLAGGLKRVQFAPTPKTSSYLLFLAAGELDRIAARTGPTEIGVVTRKGEAEKGRYALDISGPLLRWFNDYFDTPYPLPKLDHVAAPGAGNFGAMENWGAIFYFEPYLLVDPKLTAEAERQLVDIVVAHEIAHQWFGNLVTMQWWNDVWLNEGFASWMENKAVDAYRPEWNIWLQTMRGQETAMALDARASTHPIVQEVRTIEEANSAFDAITYQKGQAVVRMLEAYLGETAFRDGVRAYLKKHAYGNTVTEDLWRELESTSRTPVSAVARDFTTQPGVPLIRVGRVRCIGGRSVVSLRQSRFGVDAPSKLPLRWRTPVVVKTVGAPGEARGVVNGSAELRTPGCGAVKVNAGHTGYFRTLYPDAEFGKLQASFARLGGADQLGLLYDSWALGTAGYAPVSRYLALADNLPLDGDPVVLGQMVDTLSALASFYRGSPGEAGFNAYALGRLRPLMARVGWTAQPSETANVGILRESLILTLSALDDRALIAEARRRFAASASDPQAVPAGVRRAVVRTVATHADPATWRDLRDRAKRASSPLEQRLYLQALPLARDPALAGEALTLSLSDETPKQLGPGLVRSVANGHPELAWSFLRANEAAIYERMEPPERAAYASGIAAASRDPRRAEELRAYVAQLSPGAGGEVNSALAQIAFNAEVRRHRLPEIDRWLAARR